MKDIPSLCKYIYLSSTGAEVSWRTMSKFNLIWQRADILFLAKAIETVKQSNVVNYVMAHINCRLKVAFKNGRSKFFTDGDSLKRAIEEEEIN